MKYALTLKYNTTCQTTVEKETYIPVWELFKKYNIKLTHMNAELDSELRLHYHGIADIPPNFFRKKLCLKGFHTNLLPLRGRGELNRWIQYCYKDVPPEDWPDVSLETDPPVQIKKGIRAKRARNLFKCCNQNTVNI